MWDQLQEEGMLPATATASQPQASHGPAMSTATVSTCNPREWVSSLHSGLGLGEVREGVNGHILRQGQDGQVSSETRGRAAPPAPPQGSGKNGT